LNQAIAPELHYKHSANILNLVGPYTKNLPENICLQSIEQFIKYRNKKGMFNENVLTTVLLGLQYSQNVTVNWGYLGQLTVMHFQHSPVSNWATSIAQ